MIRGLYIANSGLTANERLQEMNSNNIANANTVGYKGDDGIVRSFPEMLLYRMNDDKGGFNAQQKKVGTLGTGALLEEMSPRFVQGALKPSDNPYAYAILDTPPAANEPNRRTYFAVSSHGQTMFTRDGDLHVQAGTGYLSTSKGDPLLPVDGRDGTVMTNLRMRVENDGTVSYIDTATNRPFVGPAVNPPRPQLGTVDIQDSTKLNKYGDTYFTGGQQVQSTGTVVKGQLEQSNVDLQQQMVSMINVMRSYEANQRMVRTLDGTLEKAVSIGRLG
jgi:flagellar basal-body rod protein FlgF